jgi:hypothetical protein
MQRMEINNTESASANHVISALIASPASGRWLPKEQKEAKQKQQNRVRPRLAADAPLRQMSSPPCTLLREGCPPRLQLPASGC